MCIRDRYREEDKLKGEMKLDDVNTIIPKTLADNEYNPLYLKPPKILMTTSRNPSSRLNQFLKELSVVFPNAIRINRGSYVSKDLVEMCQAKEFTDLIILHEHRGEPDGMIISHMPYGPTLFLGVFNTCLLYTSPSPRDRQKSRMPSSA
eukprot:TRINITY_DN2801_c0_g2_i1.p1 TRINITY_DN2801_c0_g2~~TRINITY_DN2801_c0_g2_i1.p1  ORF type:complete len:149 (-),score=44.98 TRINITY_DN2801_c0_g2_i1:11-457(-)